MNLRRSLKLSQPLLRRNSGVIMTLPALILAVFVILAIGLLTFELGRFILAREQLRTATEAAALGGAAALAGSTNSDIGTSQGNAINSAQNVLQQNDVLGVQLNRLVAFTDHPRAGDTAVQFNFIDPKTDTVVPGGDSRGKVLEVKANFGFMPLFGKFIGLGNTPVTISARSTGGVGALDIVFCFDCSGSMDDETFMTDVRRRWDPAAGRIIYDTVRSGKLAISHGTIFPQQLAANFNPQLRGEAAAGSPPGNFPPNTAAETGFTDSVVHLDSNAAFTGVSEDGFSFPNLATLVEAARGNLENDTVFETSQAVTALRGVVTPRPGYQAKYFQLARRHIHPWAEAEAAARDFYVLMNNNTDARFGLIGFNQAPGLNPTFRFPAPNIGSTYPQGGTGNFLLPRISMRAGSEETNFAACVAALSEMVPFGNTNIGDTVAVGADILDANARPEAKKVVVLFTDGIPTNGSPSAEGACRNAATLCRNRGITFYAVGLALNPSLVPNQRRLLSDTEPSGMAFIAGNESKFFQVDQASNLKQAFANIARQLTQLVH